MSDAVKPLSPPPPVDPTANMGRKEKIEYESRQRELAKSALRSRANALDFTSWNDPHFEVAGLAPGNVQLGVESHIPGKGYIARLTGTGGEYGLERQFITDKSVGDHIHEVGEGVYEVQTLPKKSLSPQRAYVVVRDGKPTVVSLEAAKAAIAAGKPPAKSLAELNAAGGAVPPNGPTTLQGHTPTPGGRPRSFARIGRDSAQVGDIFHDRQGQKHVATAATGRTVSARDIEDNGDWDLYSEGPGHYTHVTATPVDDSPEEAAAKADEKARFQAKERAGTEAKTKGLAAWKELDGHDSATSLPPAFRGNHVWEALPGHSNLSVATLPDGRKLGRAEHSDYETYRFPKGGS